MASENCGICGGDGRIGNSFGLTTTCPNCHGSGRRPDAAELFRDVTKTKASHHRGTNATATAQKATWPSTLAGAQLATEVRDSASCASDTKARLTREIIDHEASHGQCTQTFLKKIRKQVRPRLL